MCAYNTPTLVSRYEREDVHFLALLFTLEKRARQMSTRRNDLL